MAVQLSGRLGQKISHLVAVTTVLAGILIAFASVAAQSSVITTHDAAPDASQYTWFEAANDFDNPVGVTNAGDGSGRLFVIQQTGTIYVVQPDGSVNNDPFLDISDQLTDDVFQGGYTERGLLGLAFHPQFATNGFVFISYTNGDGDSVLVRYHVATDNPDIADTASATEILKVKQPFNDHKGGDVAFGPDGYLYWGLGDGGNVNEPNTRSFDPSLLLGKMLRLNVDADTYTVPPDNPFVNDSTYQPEIWALGFRNPWRFSFDRATGDLYIGDVGQWNWEEVDFQPAGDPGGQNYGWSAFEGNHVYLEDVTAPGEVTAPIAEYPHTEGCAISGGYVYRGEALPELQGYYFYGDYCNGTIWTAYRDASGTWQSALFMETDYVISSFGQDEAGELYLTDYKGSVYRLSKS